MSDTQKSNSAFISRVVNIGNLSLGGSNPIRIQSMTSTNTLNTDATVQQAIRMIEAGCELVRITTPSIKEAENLILIKQKIKQAGFDIPLIADIHFNADVAEYAAKIVEKIRINPGNYTGGKSKLKTDLSDFEYQFEIEKAAENLHPLIKTCKEHGTAIRVGVNHGSLSERIINKYGNTTAGMVESAMEFIRMCEAFQFQNLVLSMKSSNLKIMVQAYRLLVKQMIENNMDYPLHLGVTEAGNQLDGRIKSSAGIGTLLQEGIGDTFRISLTEDPVNEVVFAKSFTNILNRNHTEISGDLAGINPLEYHRRKSKIIDQIGGAKPPVVISSINDKEADFVYNVEQQILIGKKINFSLETGIKDKIHFIEIKLPSDPKAIKNIEANQPILLVLSQDQHIIEVKKTISFFLEEGIENPVIIKKTYQDSNYDDLLIKSSVDFGSLLIDGLIDGIWIDNEHFQDKTTHLTFRILQASGARISSTEFIACPSCGRTKYNIEEAFEEVKKATHHLSGLKIAVMGCIVNGPGEMADADYGYIGAGNGKVNLYKSRDLIKQGVDEKQAVSELVSLIKKHGDWKDPKIK
jgi:(E)-4-hydroxy-3-methylbut-2-enyl-diphosphate synthase